MCAYPDTETCTDSHTHHPHTQPHTQHKYYPHVTYCHAWSPLSIVRTWQMTTVVLVGTGGDRKTTVDMVWDVIRMILAEASNSPVSDRTHALLRGARKYLEGGFATQVHNTIKANRNQVSQVHCFFSRQPHARVRLPWLEQGIFPFFFFPPNSISGKCGM
jgi:hypothetical protein